MKKYKGLINIYTSIVFNYKTKEILICNDTWLGNIQESICTGILHVTEEILQTKNVYNIFLLII